MIFAAANFALMAAKKVVSSKETRVSRTFSGIRISTLSWFQQRADEADLPLSKYLNLLLDAIKKDAENKVEPARNIAEQIALKYGAGKTHSMVDEISHAIEDARDIGKRRGALKRAIHKEHIKRS